MKIVIDNHGAVDSSRFSQRILTFTVGTAAFIDRQIGHNAKDRRTCRLIVLKIYRILERTWFQVITD